MDCCWPVWEFAGRVQITQSVLEAPWKALVFPTPSRRPLRHTLLPLALCPHGCGQLYDAIPPDGAEVRRLLRTPSYSTVHYRLKVGQITLAFRNLTVEEFWDFLSGCGEVWRSEGETADITAVA
jgi:mannose-6-phosphate isomerase-like protein (cupin superfamily)